MDRRDPTDLPHDWEAQVAHAYATFGIDPLDGGADQFAFGFHLDVDFLRRKAKNQLRDALGKWKDERGRLDTPDREDDGDSGIDPLQLPPRVPANPPTLVARRPGQRVIPKIPRNADGKLIPDIYEDYPRDTEGRAIIPAHILEELDEVDGFPTGHSLHADIEDGVDADGNRVKSLSKAREMWQREMIGRILEGIEPRDAENPLQIFLGGGSGAGKGTVTPTLRGYPEVRNLKDTDTKPPGTAALIDSDALKEASDHWGEPDQETTASYNHVESSLMAELALDQAQKQRLDVVVDGTGDGKAAKMQKKLDHAKELGYSTKGIYVTVPTEEGILRAISRGLGSGRLVAPGMVANIHKKVSAVYPQIAEMFDDVSLWDADVPLKAPAKPISANGRLVDKINPDAGQALDAFLAKGDEDTLQVLQNALAQAKTRKWQDIVDKKSKKIKYTAGQVSQEAIRILNQAIQAEQERRSKAALTSAAEPEAEEFTVEDMNSVLKYAVTGTDLPEKWKAIPEAVEFYEVMKRYFELSREDPETAGKFTFDTVPEFPSYD